MIQGVNTACLFSRSMYSRSRKKDPRQFEGWVRQTTVDSEVICNFHLSYWFFTL